MQIDESIVLLLPCGTSRVLPCGGCDWIVIIRTNEQLFMQLNWWAFASCSIIEFEWTKIDSKLFWIIFFFEKLHSAYWFSKEHTAVIARPVYNGYRPYNTIPREVNGRRVSDNNWVWYANMTGAHIYQFRLFDNSHFVVDLVCNGNNLLRLLSSSVVRQRFVWMSLHRKARYAAVWK